MVVVGGEPTKLSSEANIKSDYGESEELQLQMILNLEVKQNSILRYQQKKELLNIMQDLM